MSKNDAKEILERLGTLSAKERAATLNAYLNELEKAISALENRVAKLEKGE